MRGRLIYVVGPSGSGKDSLIDYARARIPPDAKVAFARRTVTRHAKAGGEEHVSVSQPEFDALRAAGEFAMHWQANGLSYGIRREVLGWLASGCTVVVSGSRAHVAAARAALPAIEVVEVDAAPAVLRERLLARGREDAANVEVRLARGAGLAVPGGIPSTVIGNDGHLEDAGAQLLEYLLQPRGAAAPRRVRTV